MRRLDDDPTLGAEPIVFHTSRETTAPNEVILTMRSELPEGLWLLQSELLMQHAVRYRDDGGVAGSELLRSDLGPVVSWLGLREADFARLPGEPHELGSHGCAPLGFQALLPAEGIELGQRWQVGEVACELQAVDGSRATVQCSSNQEQEDPWAVFTIEEERTLTRIRAQSERARLDDLLDTMSSDVLAPPAHVEQLAAEMSAHYEDPRFLGCQSMGALVRASLERLRAA